MAKQRANDITDAQRKRAVIQAYGGKKTPTEIGKALGVSASAVYVWCQDPRFGGTPEGLSGEVGRRATQPRSSNSVGLPLRASNGASKAIKDAIPVMFKCPHCGGRIRMGGEA